MSRTAIEVYRERDLYRGSTMEFSMSREYPDWIDPRKAAEGRRTFSGTMPLSRMQRLTPLLDPPAEDARFVAHFALDAERWVVIRIEVEAELPLVCQRSLGRYFEPVHRQAVLGVLNAADEESRLPGHYEPVLADSGRLSLQDLVEDELLLGVPQVPRDPSVDAVQVSVNETGRVTAGHAADARDDERDDRGTRLRKPFAGLAEQMKKRARDRDDNG